jgi:hypothetical protein
MQLKKVLYEYAEDNNKDFSLFAEQFRKGSERADELL